MLSIMQDTLRTLGITRAYRGYKLTIAAVELVVEDADRMHSLSREVYEPVSVSCSCTRHCVERNIRTAILKAWRFNKPYLFEIAHTVLDAPPSVSEFIDILVSHVLRHGG